MLLKQEKSFIHIIAYLPLVILLLAILTTELYGVSYNKGFFYRFLLERSTIFLFFASFILSIFYALYLLMVIALRQRVTQKVSYIMLLSVITLVLLCLYMYYREELVTLMLD